MNLHIPELPSGNIYVGFSGGSDSTSLLHYLHSIFGSRVVAMHFNHGWSSSQKFQSHVEMFCDMHKINLLVGKSIAPTLKCTETNARHMRFSWFDKTVENNLFLAHNKGDQIENILFQIARGSLNPMIKRQSHRVGENGSYTIFRPMLEVKKKESIDYCLLNSLDWIEDATNNDTTIHRNKIRHLVIPLMESINSSFADHLLAYVISKEDTKTTNEEYHKMAFAENLSCLNLDGASNHVLCEVIRKWLSFHNVKDVTKCHVKHVCEVVRGGKTAHTLSEGKIVRRKNNIVYFSAP